MATDKHRHATENAGHKQGIVFGLFMLALGALAILALNHFSPPVRLSEQDRRVLTQAAINDRQAALGAALAAVAGSHDLVEKLTTSDQGGQIEILRRRLDQDGTLDGLAVVAPRAPIAAAQPTGSGWPRLADTMIETRASAASQQAGEWRHLLDAPPDRARAALLYLAQQRVALVADHGRVFLIAALPIEAGLAASSISQAPVAVAASSETPAASASDHGLTAVGWNAIADTVSDGLRFVPGPSADKAAIPVRDAAGELAGHLVRPTEADLSDFGQLTRQTLPIALVVLAALALSALLSRRGAAAKTGEPMRPATKLSLADAAAAALPALRENGSSLALFRIRIEGFAELRERRGTILATDMAHMIEARLRAIVRAGDILHYEGNGLFSLLQIDMKSLGDAQRVARRIAGEAGQSLRLHGGDFAVPLAIGVAVAPENGRTLALLTHHADLAMAKTKAGERFRYAFHDRRTDEDAKLRDIVEDDLLAAIGTDQIKLQYQPIFSADGERIVGVESLVRWVHPEVGFIPPTRFIPVAEELGLIGELGLWALRRACLDGKRWPAMTVAVNVSPMQFRSQDFVQDVLGIVGETDFEPWRLELELTEGVVVADPDLAETQMMELRANGVRIALDDFGTGYSSLIYLRRFAIDKIKIDRSFLESMETTGESAILVHSVVHLGRALGLTVTAEGVETAEQHRFLQAAGCHQLQGYLLAHPVEADGIDRLLADPGSRKSSRHVA